MSPAPNGERLAALRRYEILEAPADGTFDRIARLAAMIFGVPIATVTIVDEARVWFLGAEGLDGITDTDADPGLCASVVMQDDVYVVTDAVADPRTLEHPLVRGELGLRFYAAAPIVVSGGHRLGTVNVIDREPREVTAHEQSLLVELAGLVADHLDVRLAARMAVRAERRLRLEADDRADVRARLAAQMRAAAEAAQGTEHPAICQLGGLQGCHEPAEMKIADSWGDSAWGCTTHVEEAIVNVSSVFVADRNLGGLAAYMHR